MEPACGRDCPRCGNNYWFLGSNICAACGYDGDLARIDDGSNEHQDDGITDTSHMGDVDKQFRGPKDAEADT